MTVLVRCTARIDVLLVDVEDWPGGEDSERTGLGAGTQLKPVAR